MTGVVLVGLVSGEHFQAQSPSQSEEHCVQFLFILPNVTATPQQLVSKLPAIFCSCKQGFPTRAHENLKF
jgi:hypothetical protein